MNSRNSAAYVRGAGAITPEQRFWHYVTQDGACWIWTGGQRAGYGRFTVNEVGVLPHRWAYEFLIGPIPEGLTLDHLCQRSLCVNPLHLEPVSVGVNVLRGNNQAARAARRTHCFRGHPWDKENTRFTGRQRVCRACERAYHEHRRLGTPMPPFEEPYVTRSMNRYLEAG